MASPMALDMTPEERAAAKADWFARGVEVVASLAASGKPFSFDMVRRELDAPVHPNDYGALMRRTDVKALVEPVAVRPSGIRSRRGGWSQVYRGIEGQGALW